MKSQFDLVVDSKEIILQINGVTYSWQGMLGSVLKSHERNINLWNTRDIGNVKFKPASIYPGRHFWQKSEINWVPVDKIDMSWIKRFQVELLSLAIHIKEMND